MILFSNTLTKLLYQNINNKNKIILYNINKNDINNLYNNVIDNLLNSYQQDEIIIVNSIVEKFINYINYINYIDNPRYIIPHISNIGENPPKITNKLYINKYKHISFLPDYESFIKKYVLNNNYSDILYDVINISLYINNNINDYKYITGSYGYLYFDNNNDRNLIKFSIFNFLDIDNWKPFLKYSNDPLYGNYISYFI
jgi:hypothetical protein